jgi:hypothetical protein
MYTITLNIPDEALQALQTTPENLSQEMLGDFREKGYRVIGSG